MHVHEIELVGFMRHQKTHLVLPLTGLVTVVGANGSGKSSLIEAVSVGLFGRTLRGTDPWSSKKGAYAQVTTESVVALRSRKARATILCWRECDEKDWREYATATKAQTDLESLVGTFDVWRRTHVFSSADAAHFSMATDAERKRLLEAVLGLAVFDSALARCRAKAREETGERVELERRVRERRLEMETEIDRLKEAQAAAAEVGAETFDADAAQKQIATCKERIEQCREDQRAIKQRVREADNAVAVAVAHSRAMQRQADLLAENACPTCGQEISKKRQKEIAAEVSRAGEEADAARKTATTLRTDLADELQELVDEEDALTSKRAKLVAQIEEARRQDANTRLVASLVSKHEARIAELEGVIENEEKLLASQDGILARYRAAETVLGLKGARAGLLARTLSGLERATNAHLQRIGGQGMRVGLKPYVEKRTGGVSDAISLAVEGVGGGHGYRASSQGERRRVDFALLLALAEVAAAARGMTPGTLFFDEVFDSLDEDGVAAVTESLTSLSEDRLVVVITHADAVANLLPGMHFSVADGRVSQY
jgi:exonuclease SbcC